MQLSTHLISASDQVLNITSICYNYGHHLWHILSLC